MNLHPSVPGLDVVDTCSGHCDVIALLRNCNLIREPLAGLDRIGLSYRPDADRFQHQISALVGLVALIGIILLLFTDFRSARLVTLVLANLPLALLGGILAALVFRITLSLGTLVGFVTLFGITARNLETKEGLAFGRDLIVQGSLDRLVPILMTALVTGLALLPLVLSGTRAGQEIEHPMAVVIVGGLLSSTALNLLLMPAFYLRWGATRRRTAAGDVKGLGHDEPGDACVGKSP